MTPRVYIYYSKIETLRESISPSSALGFLSEHEKTRYKQFRVRGPDEQFLYSHYILHAALSFHNPQIAVESWSFDKNSLGKPIATNQPIPEYRFFSLSHCEGFVVCVVSNIELIGVDAEDVCRDVDYVEIARTKFAPSELGDIEGCAEKKIKFFECWTLKEAFLKALGTGLSTPLDHVTFSISADNISATFNPQTGEDPKFWKFLLRRPTPRHQVALAVKAPAAEINESFFSPWTEV